MLAWSQTRFFVTLAVAALLVMEPVSWITAPIQGVCIVNPENYAAYYPDQDHCPTFHIFLLVLLARVIKHLGDPNWVIADFTVVLAFSTVCLWIVTRKSGAAAERAAKAAEAGAKIAELALLSVEIPYLYPYVRKHGINVEIVGETETPQIKSFDYGNEFITYYFKNFGRTPAEMIEVFSVIRFEMGQPPPIPVPGSPFIRLSGMVVADGGESEDFPCDLTEFMYQNIYRGGFKPKSDMVWFSGYARYRDVFQNEYVVGFCLVFSPKDGKFYPMGGEGYNYRKKTKSAGEIASDSGQPPTT
jgi:hypothetical protein